MADSLVEFGLRRILIVTCVLLATLLQALDVTIINVALPAIQGNLGASLDEVTWVVTSYVIPAIIIIPLTPWLQARFGRKRYFLVCIAGFTAASLLCGLSGSIAQLIGFRVVQGFFGGGLVSTSQAILRDTFPREKLSLSQAIFTIGGAAGPSIGPFLGGWLTDTTSWNWVFLVNCVPGIVAFFVLLVLLRDADSAKPLSFDFIGILLLACGVSSLQYVLDQGERWDWLADPTIRSMFILGVLAVPSFAVWELRYAKRPAVDLRILKNFAVASGAVLVFATAITLFGQQILMAEYLGGSLGYPATYNGELMALRAIPIVLFAVPVSTLAARYVQPRYLVGGGMILAGMSSLYLASVITSDTPGGPIGIALTVTGVGVVLAYPALMVAILGAVSGAAIPKAVAFANLSLQIGAAVASAGAIAMLDRREAFHRDAIAALTSVARIPIANYVHQGFTLSGLARHVSSQAGVLAYSDVYWLIGVASIAFAPFALMLHRRANP
jgi:DHA2 family multidrug resistance protein